MSAVHKSLTKMIKPLMEGEYTIVNNERRCPRVRAAESTCRQP
jgi:hypothetical protein